MAYYTNYYVIRHKFDKDYKDYRTYLQDYTIRFF